MRRLRFQPVAVGTAIIVAIAALLWCGRRQAPQAQQAAKWEKLFNGQDLHGWKVRGGAKWTVQNGLLVGEQDQGKAGDIFTVRQWTDFKLKVTFRVQGHANSGIWFRTPLTGGMGYQFDILEKSDYGCTWGTIYSGGFLSKNLDETIIKRNDWNVAEIEMVGRHMVVRLNGKKVGEADSDKFARGRIGFQVHGGDKFKDMKIIVKDVQILPLTPNEAGVSNSSCYVCHLDFKTEPLSRKHLAHNIGCTTCHGRSQAHMDDEAHKTPPDNVFTHAAVDQLCSRCHRKGQHACTRAQKPADKGKVCTDCHGQHRVER